MMKRIFLTLIVLFMGMSSMYSQQDSIAMIYANTIQADELEMHLKILASDDYEGRETGMKGQKMAAEYISKYFKKLGVPPCVDGGYYQEFPFEKRICEELYSGYFKR